MALSIMANLLTRATQEKPKKSHLIGRWLEPLTLGLTQRFAEVINQAPESHNRVREQKRHLRAMEEMIRICGSYISVARPQVRNRSFRRARSEKAHQFDRSLLP